MQEFLDFLHHKYAYVAIGEFHPGRFAEAQRLFEKAVSTYTTGFKKAYLLQKPGTDEGIAVIVWDDIEDMEDNKNSVNQALMKEMAPLFVNPPVTHFYEVCSEIEGLQEVKQS